MSVQPAEFAVGLGGHAVGHLHGSYRLDRAHRIAGALGILGLLAVLVLLEGETGSVFVYCASRSGSSSPPGSPPE
ncbi:MAG: hypothetical protein R2710_22230 [Acidimicrobiales bacterium]